LQVVGQEVRDSVGVPVIEVEETVPDDVDVRRAPVVLLHVDIVRHAGGVHAGQQLVVHALVAEEVLGDVELLNTLDGNSVTGGVVSMRVGLVRVSVVLDNVLGKVGFDNAHDF